MLYAGLALAAEPTAASHEARKARRKGAAAAKRHVTAGSAAVGAPAPEQLTPPVSDPLRGANRVIYALNDGIYVAVLRPVARTWRTIVTPDGARAVDRAFQNLGTPASAANAYMQGQWTTGTTELGRFGVNTVAGPLGFRDIAARRYGWTAAQQDFGLTLGRWGVPAGPHVQLPLLGPANARDTVGRVVDIVMSMGLNPLNAAGGFAPVTAADIVNGTSTRIEPTDALRKKDDPYVSLRDFYEARRREALK